MDTSEVQASHTYLEHTSELALRVRAPSLPELLAEAGRALGAFLLRISIPAGGDEWREVEVRSTDREALLVDWLNELLYVAEAELRVPVELEVTEATDTVARARARCVPVAEAPALVKAATHHSLRIAEVNGLLEAEVIFDI